MFVALLSLVPFGLGAEKASASSITGSYWTENKHTSPLSTGSAIIKYTEISASTETPLIGSETNSTYYGYLVYASGLYSGNSVTWGSYSGDPMPDMWDQARISQLVGANGFVYKSPVMYTASYYLRAGETIYSRLQYIHKTVDVAYVETDRSGNAVYESHMVLDIIHYQGPFFSRT